MQAFLKQTFNKLFISNMLSQNKSIKQPKFLKQNQQTSSRLQTKSYTQTKHKPPQYKQIQKPNTVKTPN